LYVTVSLTLNASITTTYCLTKRKTEWSVVINWKSTSCVSTPEVYGVWNFGLRIHSCFSWMYSNSTPTTYKVLDFDFCLNSKVNAINFWQCLNDRIRFSLQKD